MSEQSMWSAHLDRLTQEIDELKRRLAEPTAAHPVSRRGLLMAGPVAAVAGAVAAMATQPAPARAATGDPVLLGKENTASGATTTVSGGPADGPTMAVKGGLAADAAALGEPGWNAAEFDSDTTGPLLKAYTTDGRLAAQFLGLSGNALNSFGHDAVNVSTLGPGSGVTVDVSDHYWVNYDGPGFWQPASGVVVTAQRGTGVGATVSDGSAVAGKATGGGHAVTATSTSATTTSDAVTIDYAGTSRALYAQSHNPANINGTVTGVNEGHGIGVWGEQRNSTGPGIGVVGVGGTQGRGSQFTGGVAQTRLVPSTASTHPTTGKAGDLFVDKSVRLWFCTKASSGSTAATWKQIG